MILQRNQKMSTIKQRRKPGRAGRSKGSGEGGKGETVALLWKVRPMQVPSVSTAGRSRSGHK